VVKPSPSNLTVPVISVNDTATGSYNDSEAEDIIDEFNASSEISVMSTSATKNSSQLSFSAIILVFIPLVIFAIASATRSFKSREGIKVSPAQESNTSKDIESHSAKTCGKDLTLDKTVFKKTKKRDHSDNLTTKNGLTMMIHITPGKHMLISPIRYKSIS
jgi:hypothetical protein